MINIFKLFTSTCKSVFSSIFNFLFPGNKPPAKNISVIRIEEYIEAGLAAALGVSLTIRTLPVMKLYATRLRTQTVFFQTSVEDFREKTEGKQVVDMNNSEVETMVFSIASGLESLLELIGDILTALENNITKRPSKSIDKVLSTFSALEVVVSIFKEMLNPKDSSFIDTHQLMNQESAALSVLK